MDDTINTSEGFDISDWPANTYARMSSIWVTFQKEGIHKYPAALEDPNLADVSFLGYPHRHIFHFRVEVQVYHDDRDIEFIQLKRWCEKQYNEGTLDLDYKSCEMLAEDLINTLRRDYPASNMERRSISVSVSEDNENGATISTSFVPFA